MYLDERHPAEEGVWSSCEDSEGESSGKKDAYEFGRRGKKRRRKDDGVGRGVQGDRARRNGELRLESFLNGLNASPLTASIFSLRSWRIGMLTL